MLQYVSSSQTFPESFSHKKKLHLNIWGEKIQFNLFFLPPLATSVSPYFTKRKKKKEKT